MKFHVKKSYCRDHYILVNVLQLKYFQNDIEIQPILEKE